MHHDEGRFSLRPRVLELGFAYLSTLRLPEVAQPQMERLVSHVNESCRSRSHAVPALGDLDGTVLLAGLPDDELEERLERVELRPFTRRFITSLPRPRTELEAVR